MVNRTWNGGRGGCTCRNKSLGAASVATGLPLAELEDESGRRRDEAWGYPERNFKAGLLLAISPVRAWQGSNSELLFGTGLGLVRTK